MAANLLLAALATTLAGALFIPLWSGLSAVGIASAMGLALALLWFFVARVLLSGVHVGPEGVRNVNAFRTRRMTWVEIQGFGFGQLRPFFPRVGWVELAGGSRVMIWAIQGSVLWRENGRSQRLIDALNAELRARGEEGPAFLVSETP